MFFRLSSILFNSSVYEEAFYTDQIHLGAFCVPWQNHYPKKRNYFIKIRYFNYVKSLWFFNFLEKYFRFQNTTIPWTNNDISSTVISTPEVYGNYTVVGRVSTDGGLLKGTQGFITFRSKEGGKKFLKNVLYINPFKIF